MNYLKEVVILLLGPFLILLCRRVSGEQVSIRSLQDRSEDIKYITCDPLCEIQAKVSNSNYETMSIKVRFLPLISL